MLLIRIAETGTTPRGLRGQIRQLQRSAFTRIGEYWHRYHRPKHFTKSGASEYGYLARSVKYEKQKLRKYGHSNPLVFSGESRELSRARAIRATSHGVRIVMPSVRKLNFTPKGGRIKMADELRTVSAAEIKQLEAIAQHVIDKKAA